MPVLILMVVSAMLLDGGSFKIVSIAALSLYLLANG